MTLDIIRVKKQKGKRKAVHDLEGTHHSEFGTLNKKSEAYRKKCADTYFFPFSIAIRSPTNSAGRLEMVATSYDTLKQWVSGINKLIS